MQASIHRYRLLALVLVIATLQLISANGCGSSHSTPQPTSSPSPSDAALQATSYGTIPDETLAQLNAAGIVITPADEESSQVSGPMLVAPAMLKKLAADPQSKAKIRAFFTSGRSLVVLSPSLTEMSALSELTPGSRVGEAWWEKLAECEFFAVDRGDSYDRLFYQPNDIASVTTAHKTECSAATYVINDDGDYYLVADDGSGNTSETAIKKDDVKISDSAIMVGATSCVSARIDNTLYYVQDGKVVSRELEIQATTPSATPTTSQQRFLALVKWIKAKQASQAKLDELKAQTVAQKSTKESDSSAANVMKAAWGTEITHSATLFKKNNRNVNGKSMIITAYIVGVHDFSDDATVLGGKDYYCIVQTCTLDGGEGYEKVWAHTRYKTAFVDADASDNEKNKGYYVGEGEVCDNYISSYTINNELNLTTGSNTLVAGQVAPQSENKDNVITSTIGWSAGASAAGGYQSESPLATATLSFGYSASESRSFHKADVELLLRVMEGPQGKVGWQHDCKLAERNMTAGKWQRLYDPAALARSAYNPVHMWMWCVDTSQRTDSTSFKTTLCATRHSTLTRNSGSIAPREISETDSYDYSTPLSYPPLLAVETSLLELNRKATTESLKVAGQGGWTATQMSGNDWLSFSKVAGDIRTLHIAVTANDTGSERTGVIRIGRKDSDDGIDITVCQFATE